MERLLNYIWNNWEFNTKNFVRIEDKINYVVFYTIKLEFLLNNNLLINYFNKN